MAARRNTKIQARRNSNGKRGGGISAPVVFIGGALVGAAILFGGPHLMKSKASADSFLHPHPNGDAEPASRDGQVVADGPGVVAKNAPTGAAQGTEYDFYTVLPGKEVSMTPAQQAALDRSHAQRVAVDQAKVTAAATAATAVAANVSLPNDPTGVAYSQPVRALPQPIESAPIQRVAAPIQRVAAVVSSPVAKPLPQHVSAAVVERAVASTNPAPVARARIAPVKSAPTEAAHAPKPKATATAAYAKSPDVTVAKKGVSMVMPAHSDADSLDPTRTLEHKAASTKLVVVASNANAASKRTLVQAGAFGDQGQAEKVKAKIAMMGLGARVESSSQGGKSIYRVRLGPYADASTELASAKQKLSSSGLAAVEVHVN